MNPDAWQACLIEDPVEPFDGPGTVDRPTHGRREDEAGVLPLRSCCQLVLTDAGGARTRR
jgi:hypothetical protein